LYKSLLRIKKSVIHPVLYAIKNITRKAVVMFSKQFKAMKPLVKPPAPPKIKSSGKSSPVLKPIPTPEERALMLAKARNLDAKTRKMNQ
jgi:hypothetical protein